MPLIRVFNNRRKLRYELSPSKEDTITVNGVLVYEGANKIQPLEIFVDMKQKLKETRQIYIPGHDVPVSISSMLFKLLDAKRKQMAKDKGIPEIQMEFEDVIGSFLGLVP